MIVLAYILRVTEPYQIGLIALASAPPAVAVVPFTNFLGGDPHYSLVGFTSCYLGAFIFTPTIMSMFLGSQPGFQTKIFTLLFELIIIPLILSRVLLVTRLDERIESRKGTLVNWSFFLIIYTIVGLNKEIFLRDPVSLIPLVFISAICTFILGYIIEKTNIRLGITDKKIMSLMLLGTSKNSGFAAGIAITIFSVESTVPSTITTIFMLLYVIFLDLRKHL